MLFLLLEIGTKRASQKISNLGRKEDLLFYPLDSSGRALALLRRGALLLGLNLERFFDLI